VQISGTRATEQEQIQSLRQLLQAFESLPSSVQLIVIPRREINLYVSLEACYDTVNGLKTLVACVSAADFAGLQQEEWTGLRCNMIDVGSQAAVDKLRSQIESRTAAYFVLKAEAEQMHEDWKSHWPRMNASLLERYDGCLVLDPADKGDMNVLCLNCGEVLKNRKNGKDVVRGLSSTNWTRHLKNSDCDRLAATLPADPERSALVARGMEAKLAAEQWQQQNAPHNQVG
jgi:hypothetical protein